MSNPSPIGVFDSGVGGLSVLLEIRKLLPHENFSYFADSAYCPYGGRPPAVIRDRALSIGYFLQSKGAKALVVACNTMSVAALETLRQTLNLPVIGVEPAVKPAAQLTNDGKVGVLATGVTLASERFTSLLDRFCEGVEVITQPCPGLVEVVEEGRFAEAEPLLKQYLQPLLDQGATTIVLGCTHYPFLRPQVEKIAGKQALVIDSGEAVARQVVRVLEHAGLRNCDVRPGREEFYTSGDPDKVAPVIRTLWGRPEVQVEHINI